MRSRSLLIALAAVVTAGIIGSVVYFQSHKASDTAAPAAITAPPVVASTGAPAASPSTVASPDAGASGKKSSNPNPDLTADASGLSKATVIITTNQGIIKYKFYPKDAPNTVKRMIELINQGFFNGLNFHRVVPGFVVQGGDPNGNGTGGSGQRLKAEFNERRHLEGAVAMARAADPDSADSQFYITLSAQPHLDHAYTVFGQVIEGMDVVRKLQVGDKMTSVIVE